MGTLREAKSKGKGKGKGKSIIEKGVNEMGIMQREFSLISTFNAVVSSHA